MMLYELALIVNDNPYRPLERQTAFDALNPR
jgi:hypothetical protein